MYSHFAGLLCLVTASLPSALATLKIASALSVVEWTPEKIAKEDFYNGTLSISNGGIPNLFSDPSIDLASNAETQALRNYANHKDLRIIYTIAEVGYRIVASKHKISKLADLRGKKIGAIPGTSSGYFVQRMMASVNISTSEYTLVPGGPCLAEPCGASTFPRLLASGTIDAVGFWEPSVELSARAIGKDDAIFFQDFAVYREIFNLHSTKSKLADPDKRAEIKAFLRALEQAEQEFRAGKPDVVQRAAEAVGVDPQVMSDVWSVHRWPGTIPADLVSVLSVEDAYVAGLDRRGVMGEDVLRGLVDETLLAEVRNASIVE